MSHLTGEFGFGIVGMNDLWSPPSSYFKPAQISAYDFVAQQVQSLAGDDRD